MTGFFFRTTILQKFCDAEGLCTTRGIRVKIWPLPNTQDSQSSPVAQSLEDIVWSGRVYGRPVVPDGYIELVLPPKPAMIVMLCDNHLVEPIQNFS